MSNKNHPLRQLFGLMPDIKRPKIQRWEDVKLDSRQILYTWLQSGYLDGVNLGGYDDKVNYSDDIEYFNNKIEMAISPAARARILKYIITLSYLNIIKKHCT